MQGIVARPGQGVVQVVGVAVHSKPRCTATLAGACQRDRPRWQQQQPRRWWWEEPPPLRYHRLLCRRVLPQYYSGGVLQRMGTTRVAVANVVVVLLLLLRSTVAAPNGVRVGPPHVVVVATTTRSVVVAHRKTKTTTTAACCCRIQPCRARAVHENEDGCTCRSVKRVHQQLHVWAGYPRGVCANSTTNGAAGGNSSRRTVPYRTLPLPCRTTFSKQARFLSCCCKLLCLIGICGEFCCCLSSAGGGAKQEGSEDPLLLAAAGSPAKQVAGADVREATIDGTSHKNVLLAIRSFVASSCWLFTGCSCCVLVLICWLVCYGVLVVCGVMCFGSCLWK